MEALQMKPTSTLQRMKHETLLYLCALKLGGSSSDYQSLSKKALLSKLTNYRLSQGIIDHNGHLLHRRVTSSTRQNAPAAADAFRDGLKILREGTKTELRKLPASLLLQLCAQVLEQPTEHFNNLNKRELVEQLLQYVRDFNSLCDQRADKKRTLNKRQAHGLGKDALQQEFHLSRASSLLNILLTMGAVNVPGSSTRPLIKVADEHISREEIANAEYLLEHGSEQKLAKLSTAALRALCRMRLDRIDAEDITRDIALSALHEYRATQGIIKGDGSLVMDPRKYVKKSRVLGRDVLKTVWTDMDAIIMPSWVSRIPWRIGSSSRATGLGLGVDEWCTFCSIHLTTSLIFLWGTSGEDSRAFQLLANFMDLVTAVKLASMRITTPERRDQCRAYMHRYLKEMLALFHGSTIRANQHLILHLPDILRTLGPAPSIWCFGFERANYALQQTHTNSKMDELASTILRQFCCRQALKSLFAASALPPSIRQLVPDFFIQIAGI
ncbi:uncharacterized protein LAESUDRAFT_761461 [Laetiporus sulphureus 93-53]|uniref:Uncharacterized protein n=1 Tax=Laetiporus sulphureus 93-53 TaxID=1314785 RepID=A0A165D3W4_9APHY|nr:uncharacterized protein LAESUDRAFT_761461 [Laetiporus sulphureus 93-53]KZT04105.1 hypothetical protein LAESUDRAFT_761461 [Laetiporus sulphureus 93-53]